MKLSFDIPDTKQDLGDAIAKQFAEIQRQLMGLVQEQASSKSQMHELMLTGMADQRTLFLKAMERLVGMVNKAKESDSANDALLDSLRGLKDTVETLPSGLKAALNSQYQTMQKPAASATQAKVTVNVPASLTSKIDSLEQALLDSPRKWRNRTFGSNF